MCACVWEIVAKRFPSKTQGSKYLPSNCCGSCVRPGRCSTYGAALVMDSILRNAYSFSSFFPPTNANTLSISPLLIAHES